MLRPVSVGILALTLVLPGCAHNAIKVSHTDTSRLTSASVTFASLQDGKDAKSAISVQLLRKGNELSADAMSTGTKFNDNSLAAPIALSLRGPFVREDAQSSQLRLRLTPDGDDTWTFNVQLALRFADETQQNFTWSAVRLDEKAPERTLVLAGAQTQ